MNIKTFKVEEWMNEHEKTALFNIADTCVNTLSLDELFSLTNTNKYEFFEKISEKKLGYGYIQGSPDYKKGICKLYKDLKPENVISTNGAAGANYLAFYSLVNPGDRVISIIPTYQQLYSIPESFNADVQYLRLKPENNFLPDLDELKRLITKNTKLICLNNPNNPTGALIPDDILKEIIKIADGIHILCDEVYRGLNPDCEYQTSITDIYNKGISICSMSKIFSLAGLRLGWIASKDKDVIKKCLKHREYNIISCGVLDEIFAAYALEHAEQIINRNIQIIKENLNILDNWVKEQKHYSYIKPKSGTTALIFYDFSMPSDEFCEKLQKEKGVFVTPGFCFEMENCFRIGYAGEKTEFINGLKKLEEFANELKMQESLL